MNFFSCGNNSCLWILILLLLAASTGNGLDESLAGSCTPLLIAVLYTMWKNGSLANLLGLNNGNGCGCGCGNN